MNYRTNATVYCDGCRLTRKRASARAAAEVQRRKRGVPAVKGTVAKCSRCQGEFLLNRNAHAFLCKPCGLERSRDRARVVSRAKAGKPGAYIAHAEWVKQRRKADPRAAINFRMQAAVRRSLKGGKLGRRWSDLVGYSSIDLMQHLERQFLPKMTWDNRGAWEVDHILPLKSFCFASADDPEFRAAWALTNLRPIWAQDNRAKNAH